MGDYFPRLTLLAGVAGFEPASAGVKVLCLTTWRYPHNWWTVGCPAAHWHLFYCSACFAFHLRLAEQEGFEPPHVHHA